MEAIGPVISAASGLMSASGAAAGDEAQAQNAVDAAQMGKTAAAQTDQSMRRKMDASLANILAVRASAGLDPNSPTGQAINNNQMAIGDANRVTAVDNIQAQVKSDQNAASFYEQSASNAMMGGMMGVMGGLFKGFAGGIGTS